MKKRNKWVIGSLVLLWVMIGTFTDLHAKQKFTAMSNQEGVKTSSSETPSTERPDIASLKILSNAGKIVDRFDAETSATYNASDSPKVIVHIQDMHCNFEAQMNIAKIVIEMAKRFGFTLMLLEGASSRLDASFFEPFSQEVKEKIAKKYMQLGQITGPEYVLMAKPDEVIVTGYGIEDRDLYMQHLEAFQEYYMMMQPLKAYLGQIRYVTDRLKDKIYSGELKNFEQKVKDFNEKKLGFKEYMKFFIENIKKYNVDITAFKNFDRFSQIMEEEAKINYEKANREKDVLLTELSRLLTQDENQKVNVKSLSFKRGFLTPAEFYRYLDKIIKKAKVDIQKYPQLKQYIDFITVSDSVANANLFDEIEGVHDAIKMHIAKAGPQKELVEFVKNLDVLEQLISIKLAKEGLAYFNAHKFQMKDEYFLGFLQKYTKEYSLSMPSFEKTTLITEGLPKLERFYELAVKRDDALSRNILARMKEEGATLAVVVTGGFHTSGIDDALRKNGISYVLVSPSVLHEQNEQLYYDVLTKPRPTIDDIVRDAEQLQAQMKR